MRDKFPTCALAVLEFETAHWRSVEPGTGTLADFVRPKDLKSE
jgi:phosphohistidine phosphatase